MSVGVNLVVLIGHLGGDPELKETTIGKAVVNVSLATSSSWKDKDGQKVDRTDWHKIVFFGRLAEIAAKFLKKGSKIYIQGSLRPRKWVDKNEIEREVTEIIAKEMTMLDSRGAVSDEVSDAKREAANARAENSKSNSIPSSPVFEDDIPF